MKKLTVIFGAVALLAACSGGGGGGTTKPVAPGGTTAPSITVATLPALTPTLGDCVRLQSDAQSEAAVDLTNASIRAVSALLQTVDANHAYKVFTRRPNDFINWVVTGSGGTGKLDVTSLGMATHETMHMVDEALYGCAPGAQHKLQFFGTQLVTSLVAGGTPTYNIVDQTIDPALKTAFRYPTYITGNGATSDFRVLLDEFAAYTGGAHTELQYSTKYVASASGNLDTNLGGMVNFMVYLQNYLQSARLNNNAAWLNIKNSPATVSAIQAVWSRAETTLVAAHPMTKATSQPQFVVDAAHFNAAYSTGLLAELDQIGVTHATAASWSGTYLP
jgi:hypothetical protein